MRKFLFFRHFLNALSIFLETDFSAEIPINCDIILSNSVISFESKTQTTIMGQKCDQTALGQKSVTFY